MSAGAVKTSYLQMEKTMADVSGELTHLQSRSATKRGSQKRKKAQKGQGSQRCSGPKKPKSRQKMFQADLNYRLGADETEDLDGRRMTISSGSAKPLASHYRGSRKARSSCLDCTS